MALREPLRDEALLFGANTMYEVLEALAATSGRPFYGAQVASEIGRTRAQVQRELFKLRRVGVVLDSNRAGGAQLLTVVDDRLGEAVIELPGLLRARLRSR